MHKTQRVLETIAFNTLALMKETLEYYYTFSDGKYTEIPGRRSVQKTEYGNRCVYLGDGGGRCAASRLKPEEDRWTEFVGANHIDNWPLIREVLTTRLMGQYANDVIAKAYYWDKVLQDIITEMQSLHDFPESLNTTIKYINAMCNIMPTYVIKEATQ